MATGAARARPRERGSSDAQAYLGVTASARGYTWRERLAPGAANTAIAISQQHGLPELLGRVHAARGEQPGAGEGVVGGEALELVPLVVDGVDLRLVRPVQVAIELEIVGRVGEDRVDRLLRQPFQRRDAVSFDDGIQPRGLVLLDDGKGTQGGHGILGTRYIRLAVMVTEWRK